MKKKAIIPGTFDPITFGHIDIIKRGLSVFDEVVVAIAHNPEKVPLFSAEERKELIEKVFKDESRVSVDLFDGLLVDYCHDRNISVVLRGLRVLSDFEYEFRMALINKKLAEDVETVFVMPRPQYSIISSKLVREIAMFKGQVSAFVPEEVEEALKKKVKNLEEVTSYEDERN